MAIYRKRDYTPRLRGQKLEEYGRIMQKERQSLIVGPERLAWILKTYPPEEEWGRAFLQPSGAFEGKPNSKRE